MTRRRSTIPLGVDVGASLTRVALLERTGADTARLIACATRPTGDDPAAAIAAAHAELDTNERRCVLGLGAPEATLRAAEFPAMRRGERERAARFDVARSLSYPIGDADLRVVPVDDGRCVVGLVRRAALAGRVAAAKHARLRPVAVDDLGLALLRAFPHDDAIVDVGTNATQLVIPGAPVPSIRTFALGGRAFTDAIAESLGVDIAVAEQRKRAIGLAGAGDHVRDTLIDQLASALIETRARGAIEVRRIALIGNAARLDGLAGALERAVAIPVHLGALPPEAAGELPPDVVRAASPDWGLAYGLGLWELSA